MTKAFQQKQFTRLSFFAADFGGFSQHSRKMFELTKAAKLADAAITLPSTVMKAFESGWFGGLPIGCCVGRGCISSTIRAIKSAIQSASFGGGSSGGGGGGGGAPSVGSVGGGQEQQTTFNATFC